MSLEDYLQLTFDEQIALLTRHGIYIGKRGTRPQICILYQLDSYYVEIFYAKYRLEISSIRCTTSTAILDPYFEVMDNSLLVDDFRIS